MKNLRQQTIGVLSTNTEGIILSWNDGMEAATGIKASLAINKSIFKIHDVFENPDIKVRIGNVLSHGTTEYLSSRFHPKLATFFKFLEGCHITLTPLRQSNETIIGILIIAEGSNGTESRHGSEIAKVESKVKPIDLTVLIHELINNHRNPAILSSIIDAFKESDEDFIVLAQELINSTDKEVRMYTAQILGTISNPKAAKMLTGLLNDTDVNVQYHAIEALGKRREIKVIPKLEAIALSGDFFLASVAIDALISIDAGLNTYLKLRKVFNQPEYTYSGIEMASWIIHIKPFSDLCIWLNSKDFTPNATDALTKWINTYGIDRFAGSAYHETLNKLIESNTIKYLTELTKKAESMQLKQAMVLLAFIDNPLARQTIIELLGNPELQDDLIDAVATTGSSILKTLHETLKTTDDRAMQKAIAIIFGRIGDESVVMDLCNLLGIDDDLTLVIAGALAKIGNLNAYPYLIKYLGVPNPVVRRAIISALNSISHPDMPYDLKNYIYSPNPYEQESAIRIAGYFGYPQYVNAVIDASTSPVTNVAIAANEVLPFFENVSNIKNIYLKSIVQGDVRIKIAVAKALAFVNPNDAEELIEKLITDVDPWIRSYTIRSAVNLRITRFKEQFMATAQNEGEITFVRLAALQALGELKLVNPEFFVPFINHANIDIAQTAIHALSQVESFEAEKILIDLLNSQLDAKVKTAAAAALAGYDTPKAAKALYEHARHLNKELAEKCIETLGLHKNPIAYGCLLELCIDSRMGDKARKTMIQKKQHYVEELHRFMEKGFEHKMLVLDMLQQISIPGKEDLLYLLKNDKNVRVRQGAKTLLESLMLNF